MCACAWQVDDVLKEPLEKPWIPTDEEASMMRDMVSQERAWAKSLASKEQWLFGETGTTGAPPLQVLNTPPAFRFMPIWGA